ncbi:hypothetical protein AVEN_95494-1, partial [Araneus ventricosus]
DHFGAQHQLVLAASDGPGSGGSSTRDPAGAHGGRTADSRSSVRRTPRSGCWGRLMGVIGDCPRLSWTGRMVAGG